MKLNSLPRATAFLTLASLFCLNLTVHAQATRTWVSGVGDDANPGSRTAPCKTYAGAISKTATSGEIDAIDPGGFGVITITKSITLDGLGPLASILAAGTPAITVNAGPSSVVTIRNLSLNLASGGTYGIEIISAGVVRIENCTIFGGTTNGIDFSASSANTALYIVNSRIYGFAGAGLSVTPSGTGCSVVLEHSIIESCGTGINAAGAVTMTESTVAGNTGAGLSTSGGGSIITYHNNRVFGNNPDGNATGSLPLR